MSKMRGVAPFAELWTRRTTLETEGGPIDMLSLPDLVQAKKTQRDKDWPMISRLVEANYFEPREASSPRLIDFWLRELRTPELLIQVARDYPVEAALVLPDRSLLKFAMQGQADEAGLRGLLKREEDLEREADRRYWLPLRAELERLRKEARSES